MKFGLIKFKKLKSHWNQTSLDDLYETAVTYLNAVSNCLVVSVNGLILIFGIVTAKLSREEDNNSTEIVVNPITFIYSTSMQYFDVHLLSISVHN